MLRQLIYADGFIEKKESKVIVQLWFKRTSQEEQLKVFDHFFDKISKLINQHFIGQIKSVKIMRFEEDFI